MSNASIVNATENSTALNEIGGALENTTTAEVDSTPQTTEISREFDNSTVANINISEDERDDEVLNGSVRNALGDFNDTATLETDSQEELIFDENLNPETDNNTLRNTSISQTRLQKQGGGLLTTIDDDGAKVLQRTTEVARMSRKLA